LQATRTGGELDRGKLRGGRRGGEAGWAASVFQPIRLGKNRKSFFLFKSFL
jgi:hypothetical protein